VATRDGEARVEPLEIPFPRYGAGEKFRSENRGKGDGSSGEGAIGYEWNESGSFAEAGLNPRSSPPPAGQLRPLRRADR